MAGGHAELESELMHCLALVGGVRVLRQRFFQMRGAKHLRRLRQKESSARDAFGNFSRFGVGFFQRLRNGAQGRGADAVFQRGGDDGGKQVGGKKRADGVVNQRPIVVGAGFAQGGGDGLRAGCVPDRQHADFFRLRELGMPRQGYCGRLVHVGTDGDDNGGDLGMPRQRRDGARQNGNAVDEGELLGLGEPGADAFSAGGDNGDDVFVVGHGKNGMHGIVALCDKISDAMSVRPDILRELGLSPTWRPRPLREDAPVDAAPPGFPAGSPNPAEARNGIEAVQSSATGAAEAGIPIADMGWEDLRGVVSECRKCGLCAGRRQTVFGVGDERADLFLAGEGPGRDEDRLGEPFVGRAGKLLDKMLAAIQMERGKGVYIANVVKCRPPENRNPTAEESGACLPYLDRQIALTKPRLLVALGRIAAGRLLDSDQSIARLRQRLHDRGGVPLIVTYHPAYLLRNPADKRKAWEDLCFIRRVLSGGES